MEKSKSVHDKIMNLYEIKDEKTLKLLIPQWEKLYEKCWQVTPFQSPYWIYNWWIHFGDKNMRVATLWNQNELKAIAPFFIYEKEKTRVLCLMGTGISDYLDILIDPDYLLQAIEYLWKYIIDIHREWDECDFQELKQESYLLKSKIPDKLVGKINIQSTCPYLILPESIEKLKISKNFKTNISRYKRKIYLNEQASISLASRDDFSKSFDELVWLHCARWKSRKLPGVMKEEKIKKFYKKVSNEFKSKKMIEIYTMRIGEKAVAAYLTFLHKETVYAYLGGFDPEMEQISPGNITLYYVIGDAVKKRMKYFDFLRGSESYKYHWKPLNKYNRQLRIYKK